MNMSGNVNEQVVHILGLRRPITITSYILRPDPLHDLLKKEGFNLPDQAGKLLSKLKSTLTSIPVLALPDFSEESVILSNASGVEVVAILMQKGRQLPYISNPLFAKNLALTTY
ncbi:hypothetical protein ACH5RR_008479 [Cinchona calisaya]|uniref:Reverse transcriptase/retrotransposon-derived protein RNase H-like domain-containing protein n=1 Tax=Cinchona calisaya TaxID=153742 RepID=A0ABD3AFA9_9GENT